MIDTFLGTLDARERGYEEGELVLYKALILEQVGPSRPIQRTTPNLLPFFLTPALLDGTHGREPNGGEL